MSKLNTRHIVLDKFHRLLNQMNKNEENPFEVNVINFSGHGFSINGASIDLKFE
jgi:hypothetical protein